MKQLLVAALVAMSFNSISAAAPLGPQYSPAGNGFYIVGQLGGGVLRAAAEGSSTTIYDGGRVEKEANDGVVYLPSAGLQLNWGFSKRFSNNMTLALEAAFLSPGVRLGYMFDDHHHVAFGAHYSLVGRLIVGSVLDRAKKDMSEIDKQAFKLDFTGLSFSGASLSYEYFTEAKNFFRAQFRADYYGIEGNVSARAARSADTWIPLVNGKATLWDFTLYLGFGSQW